MRAVRIEIKQVMANYKLAGTTKNVMTYSLPQPSTVIGALHYACGYKEWHDMSVAIQGNFSSMNSHLTQYQTFLPKTDDRGELCVVSSENYRGNGVKVVAKALKQGSSIKKGKDIEVYDTSLYSDYVSGSDKDTNYMTRISTMVSVETLSDVNLLVYVTSKDETVLSDIMENIYNIRHIGRSEDIAHIMNYNLVELTTKELDVNETEACCKNMAYVPMSAVLNDIVNVKVGNRDSVGTKYYLTNKYTLEQVGKTGNFKRVFRFEDKIPAMLIEDFYADTFSSEDGIYLDDSTDERNIVCFLNKTVKEYDL